MKIKSKNKSTSSLKQNNEDNKNENKPIKKILIYNNNRCLRKNNSAGNFRLFFEPYYSEMKKNKNNNLLNLFKSKPQKNSISEIEYIDFPKIKERENVISNNHNNSFGNIDYYRYDNDNINGLPKINNNYNCNNFGYINKYNKGYDCNDYQYDENNYYRRRELGVIYSKIFLSRDKVNNINSKLKHYYIKSVDQPSNIDNYLYYDKIGNIPGNYAFQLFKKDNLIINNINTSKKYREYVFFKNLKKYLYAKQDNLDENKKTKIDKKTENNQGIKKSNKKPKENKIMTKTKERLQSKEKKKENKKSEESNDEEEEEESDSEDKNKKKKNKENTKEESKDKKENENIEKIEKKEETIEKKDEKHEEKKENEDNNKNNKNKKEGESESSDDEEEEEESDENDKKE